MKQQQPEFADLMHMIGAQNAKLPDSYSYPARLGIKYVIAHYLYRRREAEQREALGQPARLVRGDADAAAFVIRVLLRPEIAAIVEAEARRCSTNVRGDGLAVSEHDQPDVARVAPSVLAAPTNAKAVNTDSSDHAALQSANTVRSHRAVADDNTGATA